MSLSKHASRFTSQASAPSGISRSWLLALSLAAALMSPARAQEAQPDTQTRSYLSGNGFLSRGLTELAAEEYTKFLAEYPDHAKAPAARYGLGVAYVRMNKRTEAIGELSRVAGLRGFEFAAEASLLLARCLSAEGRHAEAVTAARALADSDGPLGDDAALLIVESAHRSGDLKGALKEADAFTRRHGSSEHRARVELVRGLALLGLDRVPEARAALELAAKGPGPAEVTDRARLGAGHAARRAGDGKAAEEHYRAILESSIGADARLGLASTLVERGEASEARRIVEPLAKGGDGVSAIHHARALGLVGRAYLEEGESQRAASSLERAIDAYAKVGLATDEPESLLAKAELRLGRGAEAAARLERALERNPNSTLAPAMRYDAGVALLRAGQPEEGVRMLQRFRTEFPDHELAPDALVAIAGALHEQGLHRECAASCADFLRVYPAHAAVPRVEFLRAESALFGGDSPRAEHLYREFIAAHAADSRADLAAFRLAGILFERGDAQAVPILERLCNGEETPEEYRQGLVMLADIALEEGRPPEAVRRLREYLKGATGSQGDGETILKLGVALRRSGDSSGAVETLRQLTSRGRAQASPRIRQHAHYELGLALLESGDKEGGARELERCLGISAEDVDPHVRASAGIRLALERLESGDVETGLTLLADVEAMGEAGGDDRFEAAFQRGAALSAAGRDEEAVRAFAAVSATNNTRADEARARGALSAARLAMAGTLDQAGALRDVDAALARGQGLDASVIGALTYQRAALLRALGKGAEAEAALRSLLAGDASPSARAHAMVELARTELEAGRAPSALELLNQAMTQDGLRPDLRAQAEYLRGAACFKAGKHEEAAKSMEAYLASPGASGPTAASAHQIRGEALVRAGRVAKGVESLRSAVELFGSDPRAGGVILRLGECYATLQDWPASERTFQDHLRKFPESESWWQARFGLGWARENQGRHGEAIAEYTRVVEKHTGATAARAQFQVGECLFAQKDFAGAIRELLKADVLYGVPEWSAAALYEAGRCFEALGDQVKAREQYAQARDRFSESKWAAMATARLEAIKPAPLPGRP